MWQGVIPAITTKFTAADTLDFNEMERCVHLQMDAGCDGLIACGSLGEGPLLSQA
jgi:1-pyrroline-4-hydroxy-2-carboxylate deaminase